MTFADQADANLALKELDGSELNGRNIKVELAQIRHRGEEEHSEIPRVPKPVPERQPAPKLIVRNLPWTINDTEKLTHLFLSFGKVKESFLPKASDGRLRGFGIVLLRGRKNAEKALQSLNGKEIEGRTLAVDWAADKEAWEIAKQEEAAEKHDETELLDISTGVNDEESVDEDDDDNKMDEQGEVNGLNSERNGDDTEDDMGLIDEQLDEERPEDESELPKRPDHTDSTIFIRNLPFTCTDEDLTEHFEQFGLVRYSRVVYDPTTEKPRGTGFVCFIRKVDADTCVKQAPRTETATKGEPHSQSVLQNYSNDPSGKFTLDGRVLIVSKAVKKEEADRLLQDGINFRSHRDKDKRRLYLLNEGKIPSNSPLYSKLPVSEIKMREASTKQRKTLVESNPSLHLSLTRLAVRNIPKFMTSKDLKALAREAVVGFAADVKNNVRQRLSKEEVARGGDEMKEAERSRKLKGKGIVKQAKIVFESEKGSKIPEADGAGRSRGYGFIEYYTHRSALMGLRWLNGHEVGQMGTKKSGKGSEVDVEDRKKRLIVEFALENVNVVNRRREREQKAFPNANTKSAKNNTVDLDGDDAKNQSKFGKKKVKGDSHNRNLTGEGSGQSIRRGGMDQQESTDGHDDGLHKLAKRQQIIAKKRMARRARKKGST